MTVAWRVDEGLAQLIRQWKTEHPGAVVGTIGDASHVSHTSEHNPEPGGAAPGADRGEVDAGDFMPGNGVTEEDLDGLFDQLVENKDPRLLYVIHKNHICSSVVQPWKVRTYGGAYHEHTHVSMNDRYDNNTSEWKLEDDVSRVLVYKTIEGQLPELQTGDEDAAFAGWNHVGRAQALINWIDSTLPDLDPDGVYGAKTAAKLKVIMSGKTASSTNGTKLREPEWRVLYGLSK